MLNGLMRMRGDIAITTIVKMFAGVPMNPIDLNTTSMLAVRCTLLFVSAENRSSHVHTGS